MAVIRCSNEMKMIVWPVIKAERRTNETQVAGTRGRGFVVLEVRMPAKILRTTILGKEA
jgi:hypothetical protein